MNKTKRVYINTVATVILVSLLFINNLSSYKSVATTSSPSGLNATEPLRNTTTGGGLANTIKTTNATGGDAISETVNDRLENTTSALENATAALTNTTKALQIFPASYLLLDQPQHHLLLPLPPPLLMQVQLMLLR